MRGWIEGVEEGGEGDVEGCVDLKEWIEWSDIYVYFSIPHCREGNVFIRVGRNVQIEYIH